MTMLDRCQPSDAVVLSQSDDFLSLLKACYHRGQIHSLELERIQGDCIALLRAVLDRYTREESSSVREETAQGLLDGIYFTLGVALKALEHPDAAIRILLDRGTEAVYRDGRKRIDRKLRVIQTLHRQLMRELFPTPNVYYNVTIDGGISGYLKLCQPDFTPQELYITADYPVIFSPEPLRGVEFMERYVSCLWLENRFLCGFSPDTVHWFLLRQNPIYEETPMNLMEPVLIQTIACRLAGRSVLDLALDTDAVNGLYRTLDPLCPDELSCRVRTAMPRGLGPETDAYLLRCWKLVTDSLYRAVHKHTLEYLLGLA